ncbi:hypothetical protein GM658_02085 [Pseudoduganella eburnea]|uniref:Uncharacterized protein n=1 Tax=Massilia eburnea TaxID=1776165 RepID=A0A6L6QC74_9BURK|nr:hypothetical protein [Massilia eburnea]MTW09377.1 hypothetical protein [Massilia eburnea]
MSKQFKDARRVMLVYVLETRLEEKLLKEMTGKRSDVGSDDEAVKLVSAGYQVIEDYKGERTYTPRLLDLLGIGTGYVGLTPGVYYLVILGDVEPNETKEMRIVDSCQVPLQHYRFKVPDFQKRLDEVRELSKEKSELLQITH